MTLNHSVISMRSHQYIHAVLISIFDIGVLLLGEPGIGKSSIAVKLIKRGHSLIADDIVACYVNNHKVYGYLHNKDYLGKIHTRDNGMLEVVSWHDHAVESSSAVQFGINFIKTTKQANILNTQTRYTNILGVNILTYDITYGDYHNVCKVVETLVNLSKS